MSEGIGVQIRNDPDKGIEINGKQNWYFVADFAVNLLFRIVDHHDNVTWQAIIKRTGEPDVFIELQNEELATPARFHTALLKHGYVFKGGIYELNLLKELIVPDAKHAEHILTLGHHKASGLYFFANGGLIQGKGTFYEPDENCIIATESGTFYLPYQKYSALKQYQSMCRYQYEVNPEICFDAWASVFAKSYGYESLEPLCFSIAAPFRDISFERVHAHPISYNRGPKATGKSSMCRSLTAWYGTPQKEFSLKSPNTTKSLPRILEQITNGMVWLDEYHNTLSPEILGTLQSIYDGGGYNKALKDNSNLTTAVNIQSAIMLTSNYTPDDEVFVSRCIISTFNEPKRTPEQVAAFERIKEMETKNLSAILGELLSHRPLIQSQWFSAYKELKAYFKDTTKGISERTIENIAIMLTPAFILEEHKKIHLVAAYDLKMNLKEWGRQMCLKQEGILSGRSDLHLFFEVITAGVETGKIRPDFEYTYTNAQKSGLCLALNLSKIMPFYLKEYRNLYNKIGLRRDEIENLLKSCPAYLGEHNVKMRPPSGGGKVPYKALIFKHLELLEHFGVSWEHQIFSRNEKTPKNSLPLLPVGAKSPNKGESQT